MRFIDRKSSIPVKGELLGALWFSNFKKEDLTSL